MILDLSFPLLNFSNVYILQKFGEWGNRVHAVPIPSPMISYKTIRAYSYWSVHRLPPLLAHLLLLIKFSYLVAP